MDTHYSPLPSISLPAGTVLLSLAQRPRRSVTMESPAVEVMTDLRVLDPVTVDDDASVEDAHRLMVGRAIRLLFVIDENSNLVGLVTAKDILGERPMQRIHEQGRRHNEILVRDVMTPRAELESLLLRDVEHANVGQLIATMKRYGRQHALVIEKNPQTGHHEICGLFSTSQIARRLGISLNFVRVPNSFSEIQHTLLHED